MVNSLWDDVWRILSASFDELSRKIVGIYPALHGGQPRKLGHTGGTRFHHYISFSYDPASCEFEDLILSLRCAPTRAFWHEGGAPWFPGLEHREAIGFEIERGNGKRLAMLDPVLLPENGSAAEYEMLVIDYVTRTEAFIDEHMSLILDALREPFEP